MTDYSDTGPVKQSETFWSAGIISWPTEEINCKPTMWKNCMQRECSANICGMVVMCSQRSCCMLVYV